MYKRALFTLVAAGVAVLASAAGAQAAYLTLGTSNTSNVSTSLSGNPAAAELLVKNTSGTALGYGLWASHAGAGKGVYGTAATGAGTGVFGKHLGSTGTGAGVQGASASASSAGVLGQNSAGGPGLQSIVSSNSIAPLKVNSTHVVPYLHAANSDQLGGKAPSQYWQFDGNAFGTPSAALGTLGNTTLQFIANGGRALTLQPNATSPNIFAGAASNGTEIPAGAHGIVIGGGGANVSPNQVTDNFGTVSGGELNVAGDQNLDPTDAEYATVGGGYGDFATKPNATVGGGYGNSATNNYATVGGGYQNQATGGAAAVPGGSGNTADGDWSFAAGVNASATHKGSFVWGDASGKRLYSNGDNTVSFASTGGARFVTGYDSGGVPNAGVTLAGGGGSWMNLSDRAAKRNLVRVDRRVVLRKLNRVPITRWSYRSQKPSIRHLGPMAQDFRAAFGLGEDRKHIDSIDSEGVSLAAIQGLYRQNRALQARVGKLERQVRRLSATRH